MNRDRTTEDLRALLPQIERYFDCGLTDEEELELRAVIAETGLVHPAIDEARAVMGVRRCSSTHRYGKGLRTRAVISAAASLLMICAIGISLLIYTPEDQSGMSQCIAYANGKTITDEDEILRLIASDLHEIGAGSGEEMRSFEEELGDAAPIIDSFETISIME